MKILLNFVGSFSSLLNGPPDKNLSVSYFTGIIHLVFAYWILDNYVYGIGLSGMVSVRGSFIKFCCMNWMPLGRYIHYI